MSAMSQLKKKWEYDRDIPRCENCKEFRETFVKLTTDSITRRVHQHCNAAGFTVRRVAVCKNWVGKEDGAVLELEGVRR